jgi:hypothetical protein
VRAVNVIGYVSSSLFYLLGLGAVFLLAGMYVSAKVRK